MSQNQDAIYDARSLGKAKMTILGIQHLFAMFGATVLVPIITGLSMSATLLFAGIGTLIFHFVTKLQVPAFLGSSFAFLGGYSAVVALGAESGLSQAASLPYACIGVFFAGLVYFILVALFAAFGTKKIMKFFSPIVTGPIIISIGLILSPSAINSCSSNWWIALAAIIAIIACNIFGKGMIKIIPIIIGILVSYGVALIFQIFGSSVIDFEPVKQASWIGLPVEFKNTAFYVFKNPDWGLIISAIITIVPISLATMVEHIGDMCAISSTTGKDYISNPGLHRTLMGDGIATALASMFGAPANTTYGENTGVLNITKVFDPKVIRIAALFAILLSFCPKFAAIVSTMPGATVGGVSLVLYGMISSVGIRNMVEEKVDFKKSRNVIVAAMILVLAIGVAYGPGSITIGSIKLSGLAISAIVGIALNAILPDKD